MDLQISELLQVTRQTVRNWIKGGSLPAIVEADDDPEPSARRDGEVMRREQVEEFDERRRPVGGPAGLRRRRMRAVAVGGAVSAGMRRHRRAGRRERFGLHRRTHAVAFLFVQLEQHVERGNGVLAIVAVAARAIAAHAERRPRRIARERGRVRLGIGDGGDDISAAQVQASDFAALIRGEALRDDRLRKRSFDGILRGQPFLPCAERRTAAIRRHAFFEAKHDGLMGLRLRANSHTCAISTGPVRLPPRFASRFDPSREASMRERCRER